MALAVAEAALPLSRVLGTCLISVGRSSLALGMRVVSLVSHGLLVFDGGKVSAVRSLRLLQHLHLVASHAASPSGLKSNDQPDVRLEQVQITRS